MNHAVAIDSIAVGGDGVGTLADGRVVFVPRTAPGDRVTLRDLVSRRNFARARVARIEQAGPDRVVPPCPHYEADDCGGCQLQHLAPPAQRSAKRRIVGDTLRRIARIECPDPAIVPPVSEWGYRARISLAVKRRRGAAPVIGFHPVNRPTGVFDLDRCPIARAELNQLWSALRDQRDRLPVGAVRLVLRVDRAGGRHALVKTSGGPAWTQARELGHRLEQDGPPVHLWWHPEGGAPRVMHGSADPFPATVFEQVNPAMGDRIRQYAAGELGPVAGHGWDLYSGIGETTRLLCGGNRSGLVTVESVELNGRAVRLAGRLGPAAGVIRHAGKVEELIGRLQPAAFAVLNPPRTGLAPEVTAFLSRTETGRPEVMVYLSCDPATLARDLARLSPVYRLSRIMAFDLFPQTAHVETVATLIRR